jgi:hypothetical protein
MTSISSSIMAMTCYAGSDINLSVLIHKHMTNAFAATNQSVTHLKGGTDEWNMASKPPHACGWLIGNGEKRRAALVAHDLWPMTGIFVLSLIYFTREALPRGMTRSMCCKTVTTKTSAKA